ncbi:MAG: LytR/AlgR family response regulator transcription factor [Deltaproteobacteria bacterium]
MNKDQLSILIIEDELIIAENLKENLMEMGYQKFDIAPDSTSAIKFFQEKRHDLCLVDITLKHSELDGIETVKKINKIERVPVVYLTSASDPEILDKAKRTQPAAYLVKPAGKNQIDITIDLALSNFYQTKDNGVSNSCPLFSAKGFIFLKTNKKYEKYFFKDIRYFKADSAYTEIFLDMKNVKVSLNLNKFLEIVNTKEFIRCHRSYAVNLHHIQSFDQDNLYVTFSKYIENIPIGMHYKEEVLNYLPKI